jgi:prepilin-type N-terminal cleavage/methylation domain-containing protein
MLTTKKPAGFTIAELLIVIIVIAILATLVITAYNGVQARAANTKTISAAETWIKALRLYNAEKGGWPTNQPVCLGEDYPTGFNGSGVGQCRGWSDSVELPAFVTEMRPYIGNGALPSPDMKAIGDSSSWRRGIWYHSNNISIVQVNVSNCPQISGATYTSAITGLSGGRYCNYSVQSAS